MKKPISARIDEETLYYIQQAAGNVNGLINDLLANWMNENIKKQMTLWKEETGTDELSQMKTKNDIKCSQCCNNCTYSNNTYCMENHFNIGTQERPKNKFCCIYWEKKKGSR